LYLPLSVSTALVGMPKLLYFPHFHDAGWFKLPWEGATIKSLFA
jgi:hypothetical protein